jgi:hypothetical protein
LEFYINKRIGWKDKPVPRAPEFVGIRIKPEFVGIRIKGFWAFSFGVIHVSVAPFM